MLFSVYDSRENPINRNGDPFLYSLGLSAKFLDKTKSLQDKTWLESTLNPTLNWNQNKIFGDTHPDYANVNTKS